MHTRTNTLPSTRRLLRTRGLVLAAASVVATLFTGGCAMETADEPAVDPGDIEGASAALIAEPICDSIETFANSDLFNPLLVSMAREAYVGLKFCAVQKRNYYDVRDVESIKFSGCRMKIRFKARHRRKGILKDKHGTIDITGTLYAAKQWQTSPNGERRDVSMACLRKIDFDAKNLGVMVKLFEAIFDRQDGRQCFEAGTMFDDVENLIGLANAFGAGMPPLTYERLPDIKLDGKKNADKACMR